MNQYLYLMVAYTSLTIFSCTKKTAPTEQKISLVTVIDDTTDPRKSKLDPDAIISLYSFPTAPGQEAYFRFTVISDKRLNPVIKYHLSNGQAAEKSNTFDNPDYRGELITLFYARIRKTFFDYYSQRDSAGTLKYSECYRTIVGELALLAESRATYKCIVVHSDLLERSDLFDCYALCGRLLMKTAPERIADSFATSFPLPVDLSGIKVIFVFSARTREEEQRFLEMVKVYRLLLAPRHAKVTVQANTNQFNMQ